MKRGQEKNKMGKTLGRIVDTEGHEMAFSQGRLRRQYAGPQETIGFQENLDFSLRQYFDNFKVRLFKIIYSIPKIV